MSSLVQIAALDTQLLQSISASMAEAVRRSGDWIACKPGCTQCCMGPFGITQLDALRLRKGLEQLALTDPARARAVQARAREYLGHVAAGYPGDPATGELFDEDALPDSLDELPCPALDPLTGYCDLYDARPITCRTFGPAIHLGERTLGACELCYAGATEEQMMECAIVPDAGGLESEILETQHLGGMTIVAYALVGEKLS